ncbi:hypothetical protein [Okeania sp. KiyG1]|uniref:hypothetical protein n=1 Tax=Okeania sp. KiyG1 TaxID=2720165 RepID=UPI001F229CEF|nr:hypothetical protein [Okeania sp. KiyG1]
MQWCFEEEKVNIIIKKCSIISCPVASVLYGKGKEEGRRKKEEGRRKREEGGKLPSQEKNHYFL